MLDPDDKYVFDGMVSQLRTDDPKFDRRLTRIAGPRRNLRLGLAILLWTVAPVCIYLGGWTGLIMAVVAVSYGVRLLMTMPHHNSSPYGKSRRRPGASL